MVHIPAMLRATQEYQPLDEATVVLQTEMVLGDSNRQPVI